MCRRIECLRVLKNYCSLAERYFDSELQDMRQCEKWHARCSLKDFADVQVFCFDIYAIQVHTCIDKISTKYFKRF